MIGDFIIGFVNMVLTAFFNVLSIPDMFFNGLIYGLNWALKVSTMFKDILFLPDILAVITAMLVTEAVFFLIHSFQTMRALTTTQSVVK